MATRPISNCLKCNRTRTLWGRHLCRSCYVYASFKKELDNWPLQSLRSYEFAEDYQILRGRGLSLEQTAEAMDRTVETVCGAVLHAVRRGNLPKRFAPEAWRRLDLGWDSRPLCPRERRLLAHYATCAQPNPLTEFGIKPGTLRAYKLRIRRKLGVETFDDAVKAFVAEAVLAS